jgi:hypothetical protein
LILNAGWVDLIFVVNESFVTNGYCLINSSKVAKLVAIFVACSKKPSLKSLFVKKQQLENLIPLLLCYIVFVVVQAAL